MFESVNTIWPVRIKASLQFFVIQDKGNTKMRSLLFYKPGNESPIFKSPLVLSRGHYIKSLFSDKLIVMGIAKNYPGIGFYSNMAYSPTVHVTVANTETLHKETISNTGNPLP